MSIKKKKTKQNIWNDERDNNIRSIRGLNYFRQWAKTQCVQPNVAPGTAYNNIIIVKKFYLSTCYLLYAYISCEYLLFLIWSTDLLFYIWYLIYFYDFVKFTPYTSIRHAVLERWKKFANIRFCSNNLRIVIILFENSLQ